MIRVVRSVEPKGVHVNVCYLIHLFDLGLNLVQILKNIHQLLTGRIVPLL